MSADLFTIDSLLLCLYNEMADTTILLPGDPIDSSLIPTSQKRRIGHGLKQDLGTGEFTSTIAGCLDVDFRKKSANIAVPHARYIPRNGDLVIAQVRTGSQDFFYLYINHYSTQAILPHLAFEGATKKTRPQLKPGDLVYAKVVSAIKNMEVELSCVNPSTGKAEPDGLGPLTGGMLFEVSTGFADRLLKKQGVNCMDELGARLAGGFEIAVGRNGKVWVDCPEAGVKGILAVGKCLKEADGGKLQEAEQKKLVNRVLREMGNG